MADWAETKIATAAAGAIGTATVFTLTEGDLERIEVYIPAGHHGLTDFRLFYAAAQIVPKSAGDTLKGDDTRFVYEVDNYPTGNGWSAIHSNSDVFAHTWEITWHASAFQPIDVPDALPILILPQQPF